MLVANKEQRHVSAFMLVGFVLLAGCSKSATFQCATDAQCVISGVQGRCVIPTKSCAIPDASCPSGYRYDKSAANNMGACVAADQLTDLDLGQTCSKDYQCKSGFCIEGLCCDSGCQGVCRSCALSGSQGHCTQVTDGAPDPKGICGSGGDGGTGCGFTGKCDATGKCAYATTATPCGQPQSCVGGVVTTAQHCDGSGGCAPGVSRQCAPYTCNAAGDDCFAVCTTGGSECVPPNMCMSGSCGKSGLGAKCSSPTQCLSGNCVDGVCCSTASCSPCNSCNLNGSGSCSPIAKDQVDSRCGAGQPVSSCGLTGACDGGGQCANWPAGSICAPAMCVTNSVMSVAYGQSVCAGGGTPCPAQSMQNCGNYECQSAGNGMVSCPTSCICGGANVCAAHHACVCSGGTGTVGTCI